ncbi:MAG: hypothetical protein JWM59_3650 [Verrucomicrobiales bacterium]|nr:hypothetical protein [Verrucomicrobiales bacterium]
MKLSLPVHGAWFLLAAACYFAGALHPRGGRGSLTPLPASVPGAGFSTEVLSPAADGSRKTKSAFTAWSAGAALRMDSLRGPEGKIPPQRMREALQSALQDPDPLKSMLSFACLLKELTPENAPAALLAVTGNTDGPDRMRALALLAQAWGEKDGRAALGAFDLMQGREGESAGGAALAAWAAADPEAALKWLEKRGAQSSADAAQQSRGLALERGLVSGLARRDVDFALSHLMTLKESRRNELAGLLAEHKLKDGIPAAAAWAEQLPGEGMRTGALEVVGEKFMTRDPDGAVQWAERIAARPEAHEAVADVADQMARGNPQEAAAWVSRLPEGPGRNHAFEDVFERWTRADPLAASRSLDAMERGTGRDAAILAFSRTLARENPTDALAWAGTVADPRQRDDVQVEIARRWQAAAPVDAQAWMAANLTPDLQTRVLSAPAGR